MPSVSWCERMISMTEFEMLRYAAWCLLSIVCARMVWKLARVVRAVPGEKLLLAAIVFQLLLGTAALIGVIVASMGPATWIVEFEPVRLLLARGQVVVVFLLIPVAWVYASGLVRRVRESIS
jgi:hypothetical protein